MSLQMMYITNNPKIALIDSIVDILLHSKSQQ